MFFKIVNYKGYSKKYLPFPFADLYHIKWKKRIQSKIHDHSKYGCFMILYKGIIKENIYNKNLEKIRTNYHVAPKITYINDNIGYHDVKALKKTKSLHIYFPKKHITNTYN